MPIESLRLQGLAAEGFRTTPRFGLTSGGIRVNLRPFLNWQLAIGNRQLQ
jgi:hypothetical protein